MLVYLFKFGLWLARWPSQKLAMAMASKVATGLQWFNSDAAHVTETNLKTCFKDLSDAEIQTLVHQSLTQMVLLFFEFAQLAHWPADKLLGQITTLTGKPLLDEAYASGRGVILLVPHHGNWELLCAFLGDHYRFAALYDPPKIASFESVILQARQRFAGELFAIDTAGMRGLLRVLKQGKLVAILPDQVPDRNAGVYADFFGQSALTMTLTHRLISKNDPVVLVGSVQRLLTDQGFSYEICIEPLPSEVRDGDAENCAATINNAIEQVVLRAPTQYQWAYKRFKRPPDSTQPNIYRRQ